MTEDNRLKMIENKVKYLLNLKRLNLMIKQILRRMVRELREEFKLRTNVSITNRIRALISYHQQ